MKLKIKTTQEIGQEEPDYTEKWVSVESLKQLMNDHIFYDIIVKEIKRELEDVI